MAGARAGASTVGSNDGNGAAATGSSGVAVGAAGQASNIEGFVHTGDINFVWSHARKHGQQGFTCLYCGHTYNGGAATRLREHLSGMGNQVKPCDHVPDDVRDAMRNVRMEKMMNKIEEKKRNARFERELVHELHCHESIDVDLPSDDEGRLQLGLEMSLREMKNQHEVAGRSGTFEHGPGSGNGPLDRFFSKRSSSSATSSVGGGKVTIQQRIDVAMDKTKVAKIGRAWAKWFHANDIPGRKINCFYFRAALRLSMTLGLVEPFPKGHDVDGRYLEENCMEMEECVERCKDDWAKFGVSIMCDSWTGPTHMSIINFMVYCNTRMFFHKSIDASDKMQNADFLCAEIKKVVDEIGQKKVVQIVTDNGANYKRACENLIEVYPHIIWQPYAAHTINLILKDIGEFPEVDNVVQSAKQISRFFYNHNRLHDEMKKKIGGELIRPNATRFGTVFIFLRSFYDRKDKFQEWMVSPDWKNSDWRGLSDYEFTQNKLTSNKWWGKVKDIIVTVEPQYFVLRYADQQKFGTMSGFRSRMTAAINMMTDRLGLGTTKCRQYMSKVVHRVTYLYDGTMMRAASILDPEAHYTRKSNDIEDDVDLLTDVMERIANSPREAMRAMAQFEFFRSNQGRFRGEMARSAASVVNASTWWHQYGGEVKILQKYAMRIVSQCVSSSGCERNWSTFALIHTKVRNRLSYEKLHKLVYAHYNLKLRIQEHEIEREERELDPCSMIMDATMFDEKNPMMDWLNNSMGETNPVLDEGDHPSQVVVEEIDKEEECLKRKLCDLGNEEEERSQRKVGRKQRRKTRRVSSLTIKSCNKKGNKALLNEEDEFVDSEDDADTENELPFEETNDDEEERDGKEGNGEEEGDCKEESDENERDGTTRRSKRGNVKKQDPNSVYY